MLLRAEPGDPEAVVAITQPAHGWVAGQLARAWAWDGGAPRPAPEPVRRRAGVPPRPPPARRRRRLGRGARGGAGLPRLPGGRGALPRRAAGGAARRPPHGARRRAGGGGTGLRPAQRLRPALPDPVRRAA